MIKQVKKSRFKKTVAIYLAMMILLETLQPMCVYALTSGPTQPEFNAFTPIGTSDIVNLSSGDFNYNIPIMDVGGYPLNLAYNSSITMDQEASWVGLGWNLNVGEISRQVRGLPDDFRGDKMIYENNLRDNITVGTNFNGSPAVFGKDFPFSLGLGVQYNNYEGITFKPSIGVSFAISENVKVGLDMSGSTGDGATLSPSVSISKDLKDKETSSTTLKSSIGAVLNNRKGLENVSMSILAKNTHYITDNVKQQSRIEKSEGNVGSSYSFNNTNNYTPTKRVAYDNINSTFNATIGGEYYGAEGQVRITGYGSVQKINANYKYKSTGAYGYENTQYKNNLEGVLDFNREKEQTISKNTNALPVTNYTYDTYNIEGQGVAGMFRPFRSQTGYVYNDNVTDFGSSSNFGAEFGFGNLVHGGLSFGISPSTSTTGKWSNKNNSLPVFSESNTDKNTPLYEQSTFKLIGELNVDDNSIIYSEKMGGNRPIQLKIDGKKFNRSLYPIYFPRPSKDPDINNDKIEVSKKIRRDKRFLRNQTVQKITNQEADNKFVFKNNALYTKPYHTAGMKVLQADGTSYIYGKTVYNTKKVEATFDVSSKTGNNRTGVVSYDGTPQGKVSGNGNNNSDHYINKITTPPYAHSYLITSILSSDYQDIDNNGPTDTDLGTYTKFDYTISGDNGFVEKYKWRIPYGLNEASYNEGLKTSKKDQKGNYIYGEKQLIYLKKIETKTHIAFIDLETRKDAMGVLAENGGRNQGQQAMMSRITSIRLYSKSELSILNGITIDPGKNSAVKPIKTAHFEYDYSLCANIPPNNGLTEMVNGIDLNSRKGKLTLKKVYFTYRASNMGKYAPYKFDYSEINPDYDIKGFDVWGNYKENTNPLTTSEFPFVEQNKAVADLKTSAWILKKVTLPSGGELGIQTESDDYKYVQNKKAMQMFKVVGAGNDSTPPLNPIGQLFDNLEPYKYIYVNVGDPAITLNSTEFINKYLSENIDKPIYFKFLLNMTTKGGSIQNYEKDFVSGYFMIDKNLITEMKSINGIVSIPLEYLKIDGMINKDRTVNPISKAGWGFGRTYLNRAVYSLGGEEINKSFSAIVRDLVGSLKSMTKIFTSPNALLETNGCSKYFDTERSWIRLENPNGKKLGGGLRVSKIVLSDNWGAMNSDKDNPLYNEQYGQEFKYTLEDGVSSSGVATFEPNASPENPFVEPFYGKDGNYADKIAAPKEMNFIEKPFGESFFPSPKVTYSRVTVANLARQKKNENNEIISSVKKHATGKVVTEYYTSKDFPTLVDYTDLDMRADIMKSPLLKLLNVVSLDHFTASQGFSIETNDMDGKVKSENIFAEDQNTPLSKVVYKYNVDSKGKLNNNLTTINSKGDIQTNTLGVSYDLINDFNESNSLCETFGADANLASFLVAIFPAFVPVILPKYAHHESILRTATTTKVIHKTGILIEKIAFDLGSRVSTKNMAWDAKSGQVLLTQTINEFDDKYYSFSYPAYWNYESMGMASDNIDLQGKLYNADGYFSFSDYSLPPLTNMSSYFKIGDELLLEDGIKVWVNAYSSDKMKIQLMKNDGTIIDASNFASNLNFKVIRSGNKNQQTAIMASVTSMVNPLLNKQGVAAAKITDATFGYLPGDNFNPRIINASAVEYSDDWNSQCENGLPNENGFLFVDGVTTNTKVNPFLYNTKGNWRAIKSYAYLTGRNNSESTNRRKTGYFTKFSPFYKINAISGAWSSSNNTDWTFASQVTMFSPYGVELENKDALERYSSAQYGYNYKLPVAVASNSRYREIGFDGFEDYLTPSSLKPHFGFSQSPWEEGVTITNQKSHTGNNSIAVNPSKRAVFTRKIDGCKNAITTCRAKVIASPSSQTICSGQRTGITLTSTEAGTTFSWTAIQEGVSGAIAGSGNSISQVLTATGEELGSVTYKITPKLNGCSGTSINVVMNVSNPAKVFSTPTMQTINSGQSTAITLASPDVGTIFNWTVTQTGLTGTRSGSGNSISQILTNTSINPTTATYIITPTLGNCEGSPVNVIVNVGGCNSCTSNIGECEFISSFTFNNLTGTESREAACSGIYCDGTRFDFSRTIPAGGQYTQTIQKCVSIDSVTKNEIVTINLGQTLCN